MNKPTIKISSYYDSVDITLNYDEVSVSYGFDNEDPTLGGETIKHILEDLGYNVQLEECA